MDLGSILTTIVRNLDVLNAAVQLARWLPWLQVSGIACAAAICGWFARGLHLRRRGEHILVLAPTRCGKPITPSTQGNHHA